MLLVTRGRDGRLAGAAAVELGLDVGFGEGEVGRAVLDDAGHGLAVRFTSPRVCLSARSHKETRMGESFGDVRGDTEELPKGRHGGRAVAATNRLGGTME
jgi:hypothetical protein